MVIPRAAIDEVAPHFDEATFKRGLAYAKDGRVVLVKEDPWPVVARVQGTTGYVVTVRQNGQGLHGDCSCPVALDCKHAAASALAALARHLRRVPGRQLAMQQRMVSDWLGSLTPQRAGKAKPSANVILYVLRATGDGIGLVVHRARRKKRGGLGKSSAVSFQWHQPVASWIPPADLQRIALLRGTAADPNSRYVFAASALDTRQLEDLASTGRLFWETTESPPLSYGPARSTLLEWQPAGPAGETFELGVPLPVEVLPARDCHYIDPENRLTGPLDVGAPSGLVPSLLGGPAVPRSMLTTARQSLAPLLDGTAAAAILGPQPDGEPAPEPHFHLEAELTGVRYEPYHLHPEAHYGEHRFELGEWDPDGVCDRNLVLESQAKSVLHQLVHGSARAGRAADAGSSSELAALRDLAHRIGPTLVARGWTVELDEDFPFEMAEQPEEIYEQLRPAVGERGWFNLELGVVLGGQTVPLLPLLVQALEREEMTVEGIVRASERDEYVGMNVELPDGRLVHVPGDRVQKWVRPLLELQLRGLGDDEELLIPSHTAVELESDDEVGRFASEADRMAARQHLAQLVELEPRRAGSGFVGQLRSYQRGGLAWLTFLHELGYGGILADDLGLGKTVQLLAFFDSLRSRRKLRKSSPLLVVAPRSVVGQWQAEAARFTPKLTAQIHLGPDRAASAAELRHSRLIVTSYQTMLRDIELLADLDWTCVVFDEAQNLKNPSTKLRKAAASLRAGSRFCVTGTPIENHLGELWSQMDLAMPGLLGRERTFKAVIRNPIEKHGAEVPLEFLRKRIRPFILRRKKSSIELDLPPKTEVVERIHLGGGQRDLYESLRLELDDKVRKVLGRSGKASALAVLDALLKLRQCCCDPRLLPLDVARKVDASAKLERLMSMLDELVDSERSVLVFSQFTSMLELIEGQCRAAGIPTLKLTGATSNREKVIAEFQGGAAPVFLISLKAGGTGLNLTRADTVIHYDPWWNPAVEDQATDRTHRIGQDKPVFVYRLVAADTVEDRMLELGRDKRAIADAVYAGGDATSMAKGDLTALYRELI